MCVIAVWQDLVEKVIISIIDADVETPVCIFLLCSFCQLFHKLLFFVAFLVEFVNVCYGPLDEGIVMCPTTSA